MTMFEFGIVSSMKLYVSNLNPDITGEDLKDVFRLAGRVLWARVSKGAKDNPMRTGFVEMDTPEAAQRAIERFDGGTLDGTTMTVRAIVVPQGRASERE
jgi:RNA recognition motif-containing protein